MERLPHHRSYLHSRRRILGEQGFYKAYTPRGRNLGGQYRNMPTTVMQIIPAHRNTNSVQWNVTNYSPVNIDEFC